MSRGFLLLLFGGPVGQGAPEPPVVTGVTNALGGTVTGMPVSKEQLEIERKIDELLDNLLADPETVETAVVEAPKPKKKPRRTVPLPGPIPGIAPVVDMPVPQPEPWLLNVPEPESADDVNRLLCCAAAILTQ